MNLLLSLQAKLPGWLQAVVSQLGPWGMLVVAFLDSSFLSFPVINDVLVITLSVRHPERMPLYAIMSTVGSVLGCLVLFFVAKKGGQLMLHRYASQDQIRRISRSYEKYEFLTLAVPGVLPPPTPFKVFVVAAGVFQVSLPSFLLAIILSRGARYFLEGFLAVRYGDDALHLIRQHALESSLAAVALVLLGYLIVRQVNRLRRGQQQAVSPSDSPTVNS